MKKSVWVIDDDEIYQIIIKKMITRAEIFEEQAYYANAKEALKDLTSSRKFPPDVIMLDINMPEMDGWQFIEELRTHFKDDLFKRTRIFIVSSSIAYSDREQAESYPEITGFITKPVSIDKIKEIGKSINKKIPV